MIPKSEYLHNEISEKDFNDRFLGGIPVGVLYSDVAHSSRPTELITENPAIVIDVRRSDHTPTMTVSLNEAYTTGPLEHPNVPIHCWTMKKAISEDTYVPKKSKKNKFSHLEAIYRGQRKNQGK